MLEYVAADCSILRSIAVQQFVELPFAVVETVGNIDRILNPWTQLLERS